MFLNNISISDSITVDFTGITNGLTQQFTFPDIPYLRDKKVFAIALNTARFGVDSGLTTLGNQLSSGIITDRSSFLTLYDESGDQFIKDLPLQELICSRTFRTNTIPDRLEYQTVFQQNGLTVFTPRIIQWTKCTIYFPDPSNVVNLSFQFDIFYQFNK